MKTLELFEITKALELQKWFINVLWFFVIHNFKKWHCLFQNETWNKSPTAYVSI